MIKTETTLRFALMLTLANGFLDAYTYIVRGGVFANVQTGNVIFFAINLAERHAADAFGHLWPILAFLAGVTLSSHIKSGRTDRLLRHPLRWVMGLQAVALAVIGFVPQSVPHSYVNIPISFLAAMQIGLFRNIGDLAYIAVATTGNLMRIVESGYSGFVDGDAAGRTACRIYGVLTLSFASGALIGAFLGHGIGEKAILLPAGCLAVTLVFFIVDQRRAERTPPPAT